MSCVFVRKEKTEAVPGALNRRCVNWQSYYPVTSARGTIKEQSACMQASLISQSRIYMKPSKAHFNSNDRIAGYRDPERYQDIGVFLKLSDYFGLKQHQ